LRSLTASLLGYSTSIIYNLALGRKLRTVFFSGLEFLVLTFIFTFVVQIAVYIYRDNNGSEKMRSEKKQSSEEKSAEIDHKTAEEELNNQEEYENIEN